MIIANIHSSDSNIHLFLCLYILVEWESWWLIVANWVSCIFITILTNLYMRITLHRIISRWGLTNTQSNPFLWNWTLHWKASKKSFSSFYEEALELIAETNEPLAVILRDMMTKVNRLDHSQENIIEVLLTHLTSQDSGTLDFTVLMDVINKMKKN